MQKAEMLVPDLVILELGGTLTEELGAAEGLKRRFPYIQLLVLMEQEGMEAEREVLEYGLDAVFKKDDDLTSLNARAMCGLE
jgi:DNA-binding NarL/FixJ family response regulator